MRIVSGKFKGSTLHIPKDKNTRPLKDIARESIFNLIVHSNKISTELANSNILDLYSGTGSFGLECLSRQAKCVYFVEKEKFAFDVLQKNINKLKVTKQTKIFSDDVFVTIKKRKFLKLKFDIIFCDPPFNDNGAVKLVDLIFNMELLNKKGIIILHRNKISKEKFPDYFSIIDERIYGISKIIIGKFLS